MRIKKWEEIINPKNYLKKEKKAKGSKGSKGKPGSDDPTPARAEDSRDARKETRGRRKETVEEMFERRTIQSDITNSRDEKDRKMGVKDFDFKKEDKGDNTERIKALAQTYPFMFEKDFLEDLKRLEEEKQKETDG